MLHVLAHFIAHFALVILGGLWTAVIRTPRTIEAANGNGHGRMPYWLHIRNEETFVREAVRSMRSGGGQPSPAGANKARSFEEDIPLKGHPRVATVGATMLQRDELPLDQRLDISTIQFIGLGTIVDEKQDGKFMGTQHSRLHRGCRSRKGRRDDRLDSLTP